MWCVSWGQPAITAHPRRANSCSSCQSACQSLATSEDGIDPVRVYSQLFGPDFGFADGCRHCFADTARRVTSLSGHWRSPTNGPRTRVHQNPQRYEQSHRSIHTTELLVAAIQTQHRLTNQFLWCTKAILSTKSRKYGFVVEDGRSNLRPGRHRNQSSELHSLSLSRMRLALRRNWPVVWNILFLPVTGLVRRDGVFDSYCLANFLSCRKLTSITSHSRHGTSAAERTWQCRSVKLFLGPRRMETESRRPPRGKSKSNMPIKLAFRRLDIGLVSLTISSPSLLILFLGHLESILSYLTPGRQNPWS